MNNQLKIITGISQFFGSQASWRACEIATVRIYSLQRFCASRYMAPSERFNSAITYVSLFKKNIIRIN